MYKGAVEYSSQLRSPIDFEDDGDKQCIEINALFS